MAITVGLWHIRKHGPQLLEADRVNYEKQLEEWIENDPSLIQSGLEIVGRQVATPAGPLDLLGLDVVRPVVAALVGDLLQVPLVVGVQLAGTGNVFAAKEIRVVWGDIHFHVAVPLERLHALSHDLALAIHDEDVLSGHRLPLLRQLGSGD